MAGETVITVVGNLTSDPELRYTQNGLAVANFTIASTPRTFDRAANEWKDGDALFLNGNAGDAAGADLSTLGDELAQGGDIFVIDDTNPNRLRGSGILATLCSAKRLAAVAARLSSHDFLTVLKGVSYAPGVA